MERGGYMGNEIKTYKGGTYSHVRQKKRENDFPKEGGGGGGQK